MCGLYFSQITNLYENAYFSHKTLTDLKVINSLVNSNYKNPILFSSLIGISIVLMFYTYSRYTSPGSEVFINSSLYSFALTVLISSFISLILFFLIIRNTLFSKKVYEEDPKKLVHYLQIPFKKMEIKIILLISALCYFVFFAFVSNIFIYFNDDGTTFSIIPKFVKTSDDSKDKSSMDMNNNHSKSEEKNQTDISTATKYPNTKIIICCNYIGYVPMVIFEINSHFSIFIIPINFIVGTIVSVLVGLNISINIFLLKQLRSLRLSKKNLFGALGITTGLFVGCPTCAGSFFYSLVGVSSLIVFSSLNTIQMMFVSISIPLLIVSILVMMKILKRNYLDSCKII